MLTSLNQVILTSAGYFCLMTISKITKPIVRINRRLLLGQGGLACLSGLVFLQGCVSGSSHLVEPKRKAPKTVPLHYDAADGFGKLNAIRRKHRLAIFKNDKRLQKAAQDYANLMGTRGLYGHEIGPGTDFKTRIFAVGYNNSAGENIGVGYSSIDKALIGWLDSPGHRKNMLKRQYLLGTDHGQG